MSDIRYQINLGNCREDVNDPIDPSIPSQFYRADTTLLTADNTNLTADYSL